ncbi:mitochondrial enolase superfamily member 1 isoform X1 [Micropterus salmoides]|uniref:mitochondrial enolase superfamily member 1 isoform X1 n=1 Tax=Micropterus salmoides TaxID=27706 RepID=UPI0018ECAFFE|nr:mitochondrial enolase superfamily member 1 isoform X1 [Micropterus salmoides]
MGGGGWDQLVQFTCNVSAKMLHKIINLTVRDVRFPTSLEQHGSDAMHTDPDYSAAYVVIDTDCGLKGFGLTFTLGKGTEIVVCAVEALSGHVVGKSLQDIVRDFRGFYRLLTSDGQMRWLGPEKGVIHLATAAVLNAVWDLWARAESKPLWKLLVDMDPKQIVSCIDFRYITDVLTEEEALDILVKAQEGKQQREDQMLKEGYPAYTTSCAWIGYSDQQLKQLCTDALKSGWTKFKVKVGADLEDDIRRCRLIRQMIGPNNTLMIDANQRWDVAEAISWVSSLAEFKPLWIEEPTSPDDILGHAAISKALAPLGIGVATGEQLGNLFPLQCHNRVMFKQFLQASALQFVQIDSCRLGSVNENLAVLLMAHKFKVPVCPHAGGVGLCELVQHLILFDYTCLSGNLSNRMCEYVDHLHEHFTSPVVIHDAHYMPPKDPGYSCEMLESSVQRHQYPEGDVWKLHINK